MNSIKCCTSSEIPANPASCFAPPALKSATTAQNVDGRRVGPFSRDYLMMQVLKFASKLLRMTNGVENETELSSSVDASAISIDDFDKKLSLADHSKFRNRLCHFNIFQMRNLLLAFFH